MTLDRIARHCAELHNDARRVAGMVEDKKTATQPKARAAAAAYLDAARFALMRAADHLGAEAGIDVVRLMDDAVDTTEEETVRERGGTKLPRNHAVACVHCGGKYVSSHVPSSRCPACTGWNATPNDEAAE